MSLHPIINDTPRCRWCGPSVVCAITGWPMSAVTRAMKEAYPRRRIAGTDSDQIRAALKAAGWTTRHTAENRTVRDGRPARGLTLANWLRLRRDRNEINWIGLNGRPGHWIVVKGNKMCDSVTGEPVNIGSCPHRRKRIRSVRAVFQQRRVRTPAPVERRPQSAPRRPAAPYRAGYVHEGVFVPVGDWTDKRGAYWQTDAADVECARLGIEVLDFQGQMTSPSVVQRRRDGRFTRDMAFGDVCEGFRTMNEIEWFRDPAMAAFEECRL